MFGFGRKEKVQPQHSLDPGRQEDVTERAEIEFQKKEVPKYVEAWGAMAAAAQFRGWVAIIALCLCLSMAGITGWAVLNNKPVYLVVQDGKPVYAVSVAKDKLDYKIYVKDFLTLFLNYGPGNVQANLSSAFKYVTPEFMKAWNLRMGRDFVEMVRRNNVVQSTTVNGVELVRATSSGFIARAYTTGYRASALIQTPEEERKTFVMEVVRGKITDKNPWGLYVFSLQEEKSVTNTAED